MTDNTGNEGSDQNEEMIGGSEGRHKTQRVNSGGVLYSRKWVCYGQWSIPKKKGIQLN